MTPIKIKEDRQDRDSPAWKKICEYIKIVAEEQREEFAPYEFLGPELYAQLYTLPESIATLKSVKKMWLYGSNLKRLPPEIGQMTALEEFDPYTSYDLRWFPYEITHCKHLKVSRVSTRALFGNSKNRKPFPDLKENPARHFGDKVCCSICKKELTYDQVNQFWISLYVATDVLPLLANICSEECKQQLPAPPVGYIPYAHQGGSDIKQSGLNNILREWQSAQAKAYEQQHPAPDVTKNEEITLYKVIRKSWEK